MNHITKYIFAILSLIMLAGCSESEKDEVRPKDTYNPQNEMLPFHKTKCSETQNEASSL